MTEASLPYTLHPYENCTNLNGVVRIEVGASLDRDKSKVFAVQSGLLTRRSISFKERFSKEPNVQVYALSLPNYDSDTFELYLQLVIKNQLRSIPGPLSYTELHDEVFA